LKTLKIAIQKSGRLNEKSVELLKNSGFSFDNYKSSLISPVSNFPLEILFLRDDDIPEYVRDGIADLGIAGENVIKESGVEVNHLVPLGFGKCTMKIAVPVITDIVSIADLHGKSIATSYPLILEDFLLKHSIKADIRTISGSVEISTNLGLSHAICDIVSTGGTLKSNGLMPFCNVMDSEAMLIGRPGIQEHPIVQEVMQRIRAVLRAKDNKYVVLNIEHKNLDSITSLLHGVRSPTVVPLAEKGWVAVHTVIPETDFWEKINQLKSSGAQGIVVLAIEKIII